MTENVINRDEFLRRKKEQQIDMWRLGELSDREFVDWILVWGDDEDVEWLSQNLAHDFDIDMGEPTNDNDRPQTP
mgnify:FL=1|jgi:hypothetical protein